ncbi:MAG TPA: chorismate synthase [Bacillota bacterium]|nr:chorismate synthase [Bacillota bacterium]HOL12342.1 chorismate synthase [Bacillota bacterium]HPP61267.1 chorismate synthase [Bacillota bacterium]
MLRFLTAGESHGKCLTAIIDGMPAGLHIQEEYINRCLSKRQMGYGRGPRMNIEEDTVQILSGVRAGKTIGSPICMLIPNRDWENWASIMDISVAPMTEETRVTRPRPGHADLAGAIKYDQLQDLRNVFERASARETVARVACGAVAKRFLEEFDIIVMSHVTQIGTVRAQNLPKDLRLVEQRALSSPVRCADLNASEKMVAAIDECIRSKDTIGGIFQVLATGLPPGLGTYVQWDRRLDARLAGAIMSIPGVKGVEIGLGFKYPELTGTQVHDEIILDEHSKKLTRRSNNAGGIEGGVTNGQPLIIQAVMKPISTTKTPLQSVELETKTPSVAHFERSDVCAVPACGVVAEAMVAMELASALMERYGSDTVEQIKIALKKDLDNLP